MAMNIKDSNLIPVGYEQTADLSAVKTPTVPTNARVAIIQAVGNDVSWRDDGTNAAVTAGGTAGGMVLAAGESMLYVGQLEKLTFFEAVDTATAYVNISYYK